MDSSLSTSRTLLGISVLFLPSLASTYYDKLGLHKPLLSPTWTQKNLLWSYQIYPTWSLKSPLFTLITHMFHHIDLSHAVSNLYSIIFSALNLNLGGIKTLILFFGGGLSGVLFEMTHSILLIQRKQQPFKTLIDFLSNGHALGTHIQNIIHGSFLEKPLLSLNHELSSRTTFSLCGSSAGAYALMGAEMVKLYYECQLFIKYYFRMTVKKSTPPPHHHSHHSHYQELEIRASQLLYAILSQTISVSSQIYALLIPFKSSSSSFSSSRCSNIFNMDMYPRFRIGYAAHIGGFTFGVLMMMYWSKHKNYRPKKR